MIKLKVESDEHKDVVLRLEYLTSGSVLLSANDTAVLWVTPYGSIQRSNLEEDKLRLRKMGFIIDDEYGAGGIKFY